MTLSKEEINAIMSLAAKIIKAEEDMNVKKELELLRKAEDHEDILDYSGPQKCPTCND